MPQKSTMRKFFDNLKERGITGEDVASQLRLSISTINSWKQGRVFPKPFITDYLEKIYKVKIDRGAANGNIKQPVA